MSNKNKTQKPVHISDLFEDPNNPRTMSEAAAGALGSSIKQFGDLSGLVFNLRFDELVCGHQRIRQIKERYGEELKIQYETDAVDYGRIVVGPGVYFGVRIVDWSRAKHRAASVTANNQAVAGVFSDDIVQYLTETMDEAEEEMPGVCDIVLLTDLIESLIDTNETEVSSVVKDATFQVVVDCTSREDQEELLMHLKEAEYDCKPKVF